MVIQSKNKSVIKRGTNFSYNQQTFLKEHKVENFYETDRAEDVFKLVSPFTFMGRKFLVIDTEDYALKLKNNEMPANIVRRWVGTGKKAVPVDVPFCISICDGHNAVTLYSDSDTDYAELRKLNVWLEDINIEKVLHNAKFDMHMLFNVGIKLNGKIHDTVVLAKLVNENRFSFQLKDLAEKIPQGIVKFEYMVEAFKKNFKIADYRMIPKQLLSEYANADVWNCYHLFISEYPTLVTDEMEKLYDNELELMIALWLMERVGMNSDPAYEKQLKEELQKLTDDAEFIVYKTVGYTFNMNSNKQIFDALIKTGVDKDILRYTDKGNPKLDKDEIKRLEALGIDLVLKIQEYRKYEKLLGTYANGIYDQRDKNGKVHCSVNQTEATTGRMSITKPALQTLPKKDKRIRKIFIPTSELYKLWFMDLDQIEYRGLAHYAQALSLIKAIKEGRDVHIATATLMFDIPYEDVDPDGQERQDAKTANFSIVYGQGDEATSIALKKTIQETRRFKNHYFAMIPEVRPFIDTVQRITRTRGYVRNFYGRRRRLSYNEAYKAVNALIQSWAADYIKHRLVIMYKFLMAHNYKSRMVNIVHDELLPEIHISEQHLVPKLRWLMSDFDTFRVPITAGAEYGEPSWGNKAKPKEDVGFEPITEEEMSRTMSFNVFDGSVYDYCSNQIAS